MSVVGISLLIASFSFLCYYRLPSASWPILRWLPTPSLLFTTNPLDAPAIEISEQKVGDVEISGDGMVDDSKDMNKGVTEEEKDERDRKTMPPPPFLRMPSVQTQATPTITRPDLLPTPRATQPPFTAQNKDDDEAEPSAPSFPAMNSAQRASSGVRGPPRFNTDPGIQAGGLMPPPLRSPLPNRGTPVASSSLAPPPTHSSIPTKPRRKVLLTPGHSPLDWARLSSSPTANLSGLPPSSPYLRVPPSLLRQMTGRKGKDAWTVLGGKVYNISPYMPYHPGGEPELLKSAGRDGTRLFGEVHPWVNWEGMLESCLIGIAVEESDIKGGKMEEMD